MLALAATVRDRASVRFSLKFTLRSGTSHNGSPKEGLLHWANLHPGHDPNAGFPQSSTQQLRLQDPIHHLLIVEN